MVSAEVDQISTRVQRFTAWWSSPWGPGPLVTLALPLMLSAGFVSVTLFTDRTLLYWQSEESAAAAMSGGALYWSLICFPMGMLGYVSTFVAQFRGAREERQVKDVYRHGLVLAWGFVPILILAIALAWNFFAWAGHSANLVRLESTYLRILLMGGIGVLFYSVQSGWLTGLGRTRAVLAIDGVSTIVNLGLDAVLIFGCGPIPGFGIQGAAIATAAAFWMKVPIAAWLIRRIMRNQLAETVREASTQIDACEHIDAPPEQGARWSSDLFRRLIVFGTPAGMQMLAEAGCFAVIMMQVGRLGEMAMAATTLALGLNVLGFVPMIGLGIGVGVLVGERLTEGKLALARRGVACALGVVVLYTSCFAGLLLLFPDAMVSVYAWGASVERFETMKPLMAPLLKIIAIYCILDGLQVVFVGAIKGAGDTWFVLGTTFIVSTGSVATGLVCQHYLGPSLLLWWYVIAGWVTLMGVSFAARYFSGSWESKRVIA